VADHDVEEAGNPVLPLVKALRAELDDDTAALVHRGLTSQDVLDSALMLLAKDALAGLDEDLGLLVSALAVLADTHRDTVMAGRTLTQHAVPVTFGLKAAQWLVGVLDARAALARLALPVQCGGAAGTLSKAADLLPDPVRAAAMLAETLGLAAPSLPWHTRRTPVTRLGDALAETCQALGVIAGDVLLLGRPEVGEVNEGGAPGKGASSTMPHKRNPVLSVLVRSASLRAPFHAAQLHACAGAQTDERADGAWHAEWPALRDLLSVTSVAADQAADLVDGLVVHQDVMTGRAHAEAESLLAERGGGSDPSAYLGASGSFVDAVLSRVRRDG
jgi:3-carboxy-cis,cis-muconate cycloisomerase